MQTITAPQTDLKVIDWQELPGRPRLTGGELHLWRVDLEYIAQTADLGRLLSAVERARFSRLVFPEKRELSTAGRAALRLILAKYLNLMPRAIRFGFYEMGKPYLVNSSFGKDLQFNLSHCERWMILGICERASLGVDVEELRPINHAWAIKNLFSTKEQEHLFGVSEDGRDRAFIAAWTKKEAAAKADGAGLGGFSLNRRLSNSLLENFPFEGHSFYWEDPFWFLHFEPAPGYLVTVAMQSIEKPLVKFYKFSLGN